MSGRKKREQWRDDGKNNKAGKERGERMEEGGESRRGERMMKLEDENEREMKTHN